jgi:hypothetical protein
VGVTSFGDLVTEAERVLMPLAATRELNASALAAAWLAGERRDGHWQAMPLLSRSSLLA